jgi:hypothetical protein
MRHHKLWALIAALLTASATLVVALASSAGASAGKTPAADCQPFGSRPCLLPFPNNLFTRRDRSTPTGLRVHLPVAAMPVNAKGQRLGVAEYDRNDGFSPGSAAIVHVAGLDNAKAFARTGAVGLLNMAQAYAKNQPIVVIDQATGRRQLIYAQLDANATTRQATNLMILPGKEYTEGHTYIVALRHLRDARGRLIPAPSWFAKLRDQLPLPAGERSQRVRYAKIFAALERAGIRRSSLYEAWDFTVASTKSLTSRLLSIRNDAFARLGDHNLADGAVQGSVPAYTITSTTQLSPQLKEVQGTFQVPCYLITCGSTASTAFHYSSSRPDALPTQAPGNVGTAAFACVVPTAASPTDPARISIYGHGLFEDHTLVTAKYLEPLAVNDNIAFCGTDWWGLAAADQAFDAGVIANLNLFPVVADRLQQGVVNTLYLGRLMRNPHGFASNPVFQSGGRPVIDSSHLYYYGNSQGGIAGGMATAVAPDWTRAVLGVTGIDFGNLLVQRSTDFTPLKAILETSYPDQSLYPVILDIVQQLWDRGDPDGYAPQMTAHPLPDTPSHTVLMQIAYGDFQVSIYAAAAEARSVGVSAHQPALGPTRSRDRNLFYGIPAIRSYPFAGSAIEIWDSGPARVQPPPVGNVPPAPGANNADTHFDPRYTPAAQQQITDFLAPNGSVVNVCGSAPCRSVAAPPNP